MVKNSLRECVVAIIQKSDKFLFIKRADYLPSAAGYWCPVSGRIEKGETQKDALMREVKEEIGLNVIAKDKICMIPSHDGQYCLHYWTTEIISGTPSITSDEVSEIRWVTIKTMHNLRPIFEEDIQIFKSINQKEPLR